MRWKKYAGVCRLLPPRRLHEPDIDVSEGFSYGFWPPPPRSLANRCTKRGLEMEKEEEDGETRDLGELVGFMGVGSVPGGVNATRLSISRRHGRCVAAAVCCQRPRQHRLRNPRSYAS